MHEGSPKDRPLSRPQFEPQGSHPFAAAFVQHFAALRRAHQASAEEGVLIACVSKEGRFDSHAHLRLPGSGVAHLVLGRHERCDLVIGADGDTQISLRHALLRAVRGTDGRMQLRVVDLRSRSGLRSEEGERCEAIAGRVGPLFFRLGGHSVFLLPTGPTVPRWGDDAKETFAAFAPRVQEILAPPQPLRSRAAPGEGAVRLASITLRPHPPRDGDLSSTHGVFSDQLERGILLGRDDRCSHGVSPDEGNLSRVHLMLLSVDGEVWAVDTASTNGSRVVGGQAFRQTRLSGPTQLLLADSLLVDWQPELLAARA